MAKNIKINNDNECCGCKACLNICPNNAISMKKNREGFLYPAINNEKCIECGLCIKVCPFIDYPNRYNYLEIPMCYASRTKDRSTLEKSTSGGVFYEIARHILNINGIVYGSHMDNNLNVKHIAIERIEDLYKIMGSKYVYSDLENIFKDIKDNLENNRLVLFSGVPCQISALRKFLIKEYDNLFTCEVICHGTPNQEVFSKYIEYLEDKYKGTIVDYQFRNKKASNWGTFKALVKIKKKNKIITKKLNADFDKYYFSFLNGDNYRESCYECKYAQKTRYADITLGDFWGIEKINNIFPYKDGVSALLINSRKGIDILNIIKDKLELQEVSYLEISKQNGQLNKATRRKQSRDNWYDSFENNEFIRKIRIPISLKNILKIFIPSSIKLKIKKFIK